VKLLRIPMKSSTHFRRKASTRSGSNRPAVPVEIVRLFQAKSSTCSGSKESSGFGKPGRSGRSEATRGHEIATLG